MSLQPLSTQLHIIDGVVQPSTLDVVGIYSGDAPDNAERSRARDSLFLHLSLGGPMDETQPWMDELRHLFVYTYHHTTGSVTAALRRSVLETNHHLVKLNRSVNLDRKGSLACAVLRNDELFMVQVGEAFAFIGHTFGLEPIPPERPETITPLGQPSGLDMRYFHHWLQAGDLLMLSDPRIAHLASQRFVDALVKQSAEAAAEALPQLLTRQSARLLLVEFSDEASRPLYATQNPIASAPVLSALTSVASAKPIRKRDEEARSEELLERRKMLEQQARELREQEALAELNPVYEEPDSFDFAVFEEESKDVLPARPVMNEPDLPDFDEALEPPDVPSISAEPLPELYRDIPANPTAPSAEPDFLDFDELPSEKLELIEPEIVDEFEQPDQLIMPVGPPVRDLKTKAIARPPETISPDEKLIYDESTSVKGDTLERQSRQVASGALGGLSKLFRWLAEFLTRLRKPNARDLDAPRGERFWATLLAIVIPVVVALVVSGVYLQSRERSQITNIRNDLTVTLNEAIALEGQDTSAARNRYLEVIVKADNAGRIIEDNSEIVAAKQYARSAIDRIDNVLRLTARTLYRYPVETSLSSIALGTDESATSHVYVLDSENDFVDDHITDLNFQSMVADPTTLVQRGQGVQREVVGDLIDIDWKPITANNAESLVVLDAAGFAVSHFPASGDSISAPLGLASSWGTPVALTSYTGRIYVLDRGNNPGIGQMWRYLPDGRAFTINEDTKSIEYPDMNMAIDAVIHAEDASVLVLYADGRLRRYRDDRLIWDENTVAAQGLNEPLVSPIAIKIAGSGPLASIFVLDPGSNRIVEFSFAGSVLNQFRADLDDGSGDLFARATDMHVQQRPLRIFLVAENTIVVAESQP